MKTIESIGNMRFVQRGHPPMNPVLEKVLKMKVDEKGLVTGADWVMKTPFSEAVSNLSRRFSLKFKTRKNTDGDYFIMRIE
jgi:hypothetical protein